MVFGSPPQVLTFILVQITIVAQVVRSTVRELNQSRGRSSSRSTTYVLEDGTGSMKLGQINAFHSQPAKSPSLRFPLGLARVIGVMTAPSGFKNSIKVIHMRPVSDPMEVFQHLMEAMSVTHSYSPSRGITTPPVSRW